MVSIFERFEKDNAISPEEANELRAARKDINEITEYASVDLENAYKKDGWLACEAAG
ncbi:hypothetical protein K9B35_00500 [Sphingomonas sp. R647]|uniref:hypothetical protein n=1 Tax=Sphingomonas sp. R647 TaxID=2875233 RepID=UPI001CD2F1F9|nr:hypothetical protein [Sphingomonas sp. R647]MCA1196435.1 hypothetical protein [Sphingomonas sp. R647]